MSTATFDTLSAARALEGAGMDAAQAAVVVETVRSAVVEGTATKADIVDIRADLAALELRLTKQLHRQTALLAGLVAAAAALFRLLG